MPCQENRRTIDDNERRGLLLGQQIETSVHGEAATAVVLACCWVLAAVIVQSVEEGDDVEHLEAIAATTKQLCVCVHQLQSTREQVKH